MTVHGMQIMHKRACTSNRQEHTGKDTPLSMTSGAHTAWSQLPAAELRRDGKQETMPFFSICDLTVSPSVKDLPLVAGSLFSSAQGQLLL